MSEEIAGSTQPLCTCAPCGNFRSSNLDPSNAFEVVFRSGLGGKVASRQFGTHVALRTTVSPNSQGRRSSGPHRNKNTKHLAREPPLSGEQSTAGNQLSRITSSDASRARESRTVSALQGTSHSSSVTRSRGARRSAGSEVRTSWTRPNGAAALLSGDGGQCAAPLTSADGKTREKPRIRRSRGEDVRFSRKGPLSRRYSVVQADEPRFTGAGLSAHHAQHSGGKTGSPTISARRAK